MEAEERSLRRSQSRGWGLYGRNPQEVTHSSNKAVISQSFPVRRKVQADLKEEEVCEGMDMISLQMWDASLPLFSEAAMINGVQAEET